MDAAADLSLSTEPHRAYVTVMQGCDNYCSNCIVPYARGPEVSRDARRVIEEVRMHADNG
jgi:tRNA-2-methylthio-N6-dimethylallyladenosine synthase